MNNKFRETSRDKYLESVLNHLFFSKGKSIPYESNEGIIALSSVYIIPIVNRNNSVSGLFKFGEDVVQVPLGFEYIEKANSQSSYYTLTNNMYISPTPKLDELLWLPIEATRFGRIWQGMEKEVSVYDFMSGGFLNPRFLPSFGTNALNGLRPLLFVEKKEDNYNFFELLKDSTSLISVNPLSLSELPDNIKDACGKIIFSPTKVGKEFIRPLEKMKPLENQPNQNKSESQTQSKDAEKKGIHVYPQIDWENPKSIVKYLDEYVIGQDDAKRIVAVTFSNFMVKKKTEDEDIYKENLLLLGPSGVGKTYMISLLAKAADLPFVESSLVGKSSEGYKGENLSSVLEQLVYMSDEEAPFGIVFLDEIDKLALSDSSSFGPKLQDELIGWLENTCVSLDIEKETCLLSTKNILFIAAGAFRGQSGNTLESVIERRLGVKGQALGFGVKKEEGYEKVQQDFNLIHRVLPEDLIKYGLKPELVGRISAVGVLDGLTTENKVKILSNAKKSPLLHYKKILAHRGYELILDEDVLKVIAEACPPETGARALNPICSNIFSKVVYDPDAFADSKRRIAFSKETVKNLIDIYL